MPLKLNVGISKKVGLPDYGSLGSSCNVELELDGSLIFEDLDGFHQKVRQAYVACAQAVNDELSRQQGNGQHTAASTARPNTAESASNGNGHRNGTNGHRATEKQVNYIRQLSGQIRGLGVRRLETLANKMFDKPVADLSSLDASSLIDTLKAIKEGRLELDVALNGAAK